MLNKNAALAPTRNRKQSTNKSKNAKWSLEEDQRLSKLMAESPGASANDLLCFLPDKNVQQITERWEKVLSPDIIKGSWTREEDEAIIHFVNQNGTKDWTKLAAILPGRIGKQCRERWRNHLTPDINKDPWTVEEDNVLIELHENLGNQWVKMAESLPGRSDNCVKNRWNSTLKKRLFYSQEGIERPRRGRPSIKNVPKSADCLPKPPKFEEIEMEIKAQSPSKPTTTTVLLSPFTNLKSPFNMASPNLKDYSNWSPSKEHQYFDGIGLFSPNIFSPSLNENRTELMNLLSPKNIPKFDPSVTDQIE